MLWHGKNFRGFLNKAKEVLFNNTGTSLQSTNVEDAIKEVNSNLTHSINFMKVPINQVQSATTLSNGVDTTATVSQNCWIQYEIFGNSSTTGYLTVNGAYIVEFSNSAVEMCGMFPVEAGSEINARSTGANGIIRYYEMA